MDSTVATLSPEYRAHEFPMTRECVYLNTATHGILPFHTRQALDAAAARAQFPGSVSDVQPPDLLARTRLAALLGVAPESLAFTPNTTHGLNICAHGIAWQPGDNVVVPEREFPSLMRAWLNLRSYGVEVRVVPWSGVGPTVDTLMAAVDGHTRVVTCSAVAWDTGYRIDIEELGRRCAARGVLLIVDAIQAIGAVELNPAIPGLAALSFHGYKWLLAGFGCGVLYVAPEALDQIRPRFVGQPAFADGAPIDAHDAWQPGATRFATGGSNTLGLTALAASLEVIEAVGLSAIAKQNHALIAQLFDGLAERSDIELVTPRHHHAAIVVFTRGSQVRDTALVEQLAAAGIHVALRPRGIRVSPHLYNTPADIEQLLSAI